MAKLSIVVPVYFNELNLPTTIPALLNLEAEMGADNLELVFVDDGSGDQSLKILTPDCDLIPGQSSPGKGNLLYPLSRPYLKI